MAEAVIPPPPEGFVVQDVPPPPEGFQMTGGEADTKGQGNAPSWIKSLLKAAGQSALPTAGAIGGAALGAAIPIPGGTLIGESLGGGLGEQINQWAGFTEPSKTNVAINAATGPLSRALGPILKGAGGTAMKIFGKRDLVNDIAEGVLKKELLPKVGSQALYNRAEQQAAGLVTPSRETARTVNNMVNKEINAMPTEVRDEVLKAIGPLKDYFQIPGRATVTQPTGLINQAGQPIMKTIPGVASKIADVPAKEMMDGVARLRFQASKAYEAGNMGLYHSLDNVRSSVLNDLENSGVPAIKKAAQAYRKEMAVEELGMIARKPRPFKEWKDALDESKLFAKSFDPGEKAQIQRILKKISWVSPSGGSGHIGRAIATGAGFEAGGPMAAAAAFIAPEAMEKLLGTKFGRNMAEKILGESAWRGAEKYTGTQAARLAALQMFARGLTSNEQPPE